MALEDLQNGITASGKLIAHLQHAVRARGYLWQLLKSSSLLQLQGRQRRKSCPGLHVIGWQTFKVDKMHSPTCSYVKVRVWRGRVITWDLEWGHLSEQAWSSWMSKCPCPSFLAGRNGPFSLPRGEKLLLVLNNVMISVEVLFSSRFAPLPSGW